MLQYKIDAYYSKVIGIVFYQKIIKTMGILFKATLVLEGMEFEVLNLSYGFNRYIDDRGQPTSNMRSNLIQLELAMQNRSFWMQWATNPYAAKDGCIDLYVNSGNPYAERLEFERAYLIEFSERIDTKKSEAILQLSLSAKKISYGNAVHENPWPEA